jgi:hypothetical protein
MVSPHLTYPPPPAKQPTASASKSGARPESPRPGAVERGAGRERRGRNLRPLPQPMDGSNSAIERYLSQALVLNANSSKVCSQKNPWRVRLRQGHASRRSSRLPNAIRHLHSRHGVIAAGVRADTLKALPTLRDPPNRHLLPSNPLRTPLGQVLALRNQTLMNRTGQQGDAVPADLVAEVLAGDTDA